MGKLHLGKRGEIFVMKKLHELGWNVFDYETKDERQVCDIIASKENKRLYIEVKASEKYFKKGTWGRYQFANYKKQGFDFILFTNLIDIWILPKHLTIIYGGRTLLYTTRQDIFRNNFKLLDMSESELCMFLTDYYKGDWKMPSKVYIEPSI